MLDFPRMIQLETTTACNASCVICPNAYLGRGPMDDDTIWKVLEELAVEEGRIELHPFFTNEPLMDLARQYQILDYCRDHAPNLEVHYYTNMGLLTPLVSERLLDSPAFSFISFSVDGITKEMFEAARPGLNFEKCMEHAYEFMRLRKLMGREDVRTKAVMTLTRHNASQAREFLETWKPLVNEAMTMGSDGRAVMDFTRMKEAEETREGVFHNDPRWPCRRHKCHEHSMYILSNGDVVPCCKDATGMTVLGNVKEASLRTIWHSDRFNEVRKKLDTEQYDEAACKACPFGGMA